jgi:hypothetical protein
MSSKLVIGDDVIAAYKFVHSDEQKGNAFAVIGFADNLTLTVIHKAEDGKLEDIYSHFPAEECRFALTKRTFKVEMANAVKFIYLDWTPQGVKASRRAVLATLKRQASDAAKPFHIDFQLDDIKDVTEELIQSRLGHVSGVSKSQLNVAVTTKHEYGSKGATARAAENVQAKVEIKSTVKWENEGEFKDNLAKLRSNSVNWVLARYSKKDTIQFIGSGNGDASELSGSLNNDFIEFGLLRVVDVVDKSSTVKYAYVEWIGPNCAAMLRGYFNSKKRKFSNYLSPIPSNWTSLILLS